jgi:protein gp37
MGDKTGIEWTDHTFNPWWGCARVSPACEHCYAETFAARWGVKWGVKADRRIASAKIWDDPLRWNRAAEKACVRRRVFCASMADVFEARTELYAHRSRLFDIVTHTPNLDWQLLTKRIGHVCDMVPAHWMRGGWPCNAWIGTTVEDQRRADERIPHLLALPAPVRFLSCEPLLGPVDIDKHMRCPYCAYTAFDAAYHMDHHICTARNADAAVPPAINWVICGGESGPGARPMHPDWARSLRDQCKAAGVPFFFKQWGEYVEGTTAQVHQDNAEVFRSQDGPGGRTAVMVRVGKKAAGSLLDGVEHKAFPR